LSKAAQAFSTAPSKGVIFAGRVFCRIVFGSKAAKALSTAPSKGVTFAGLVFWSKAAKALSTAPSKGVTFAGLVFLVESGQGPFDSAVKRRDFCRACFAGLGIDRAQLTPAREL
jgi:hypothetical protein